MALTGITTKECSPASSHFFRAPPSESVWLAKMDTSSYKQLPVSLYQIQNKYRDEKRPRFGLMRSREFIMKDAYTFDMDEEGLDRQYHLMYDAYTRIFTRCGLHFRPVVADSGAIGGSGSHEFEVIADSGEADIVYCKDCDFAANIEAVEPKALSSSVHNDKAKEIVETPGQHTIQMVCDFLHVPVVCSVKAVVYKLDDTVVLALVRGDHEVNEVRLQNLFNAVNVGLASDEDLKRCGLIAGYISPIGLKKADNFEIIVDTTVMEMEDACCGANAVDKHYVHVNPKRDFGDVRVETIRLITAEDCCPKCGGMIELKKGIEVGQVFKLGTKYSEKLGCTYLDRDGKTHPMVMGCYGIGITRTVAASIEQNHDKDGIIWPVAIAPYEVVIVPANNKDEGVMNAARHLYDEMEDCRDEVILDDRDERAGIKFKDADLIGYPIRVTIGKKWKESGLVEVRLRRSGVVSEVALADCKTKVLEMLEELHKKNL